MLYRLARILFVIFFKVFFRWRVFGRENIPRGAFIICSNHISWFDPPLVGGTIEGRRIVHFMAKEELFQNPVAGAVLRRIGTFPVRRDRADRRAIKRALELLREDKIVGMFPEGTRSKTGHLQELLEGAALLALKSKVPVLPVAIKGPYRVFRPLRVYIGEPLSFNSPQKGTKYKREELNSANRAIWEGINSLLTEQPLR